MRFTFDGREIPYADGQSVAAALWAAGVRSWRTSRERAAPRGLFCGIGACFDCLSTVDGQPNRRACLVPAAPGMAVTSQAGPGTPAAPAGSGGPAAAPSAPAGGPAATSTPVERRCDVAVVGAGPAGLAAAATAAGAGLGVVLLDAAPRAGGQFWRHRAGDTGAGHRDWAVFAGLRAEVERLVEHWRQTEVWFVEPGFLLHTSTGVVRADRLVLATGAYDRTLPFPGWDLPGVVTAGGAQALLKGSGVVVGERVVVAGAGPFLLPVAAGLLAAGARVEGVYEAGDPRGYLGRRRPTLAALAGRLPEAARYAGVLARHRVPYHTRHTVLAARGEGALSEVEVARVDRAGRAVPGSRRRIACDALAVGWGFTPSLELPLALGCATWVGHDGSLVVAVDPAGRTSVPGVYAAGEVTGVGGAELAVAEGRLVGAALARERRRPAPFGAVELTRLLTRRAALRRFAAAMHAVHAPPAGWPERLAGDTPVCRCEEVPYSAVVEAVDELGATDGRSVKLFARPGMGWCQGRVCGYATAVLAAQLCGRPVAESDLGAFAARPLAQPVTLGDLAGGGAQR
ncbi:MAG TPA: FAD-dependent oxidoreductase [Micromonosporaceae bacterium]|nr:FAD-dependent oxidoreductase [Micromonosporaceae bacterium]